MERIMMEGVKRAATDIPSRTSYVGRHCARGSIGPFIDSIACKDSKPEGNRWASRGDGHRQRTGRPR
jgi:hypothetical protein